MGTKVLKNVVIVYHAVDPDGWSSAWIAGNAHAGENVSYVPYTYGWSEARLLDAIPDGAHVVAVDISFSIWGFTSMIEQSGSVTWIDHHISAIELTAGEETITSLPGIRREGDAGCELAWEYYNPGKPMPYILKMVGRADVRDLSYAPEFFYVRSMIGGHGVRPNDPEFKLWGDWANLITKEDVMAHPTWGPELIFGKKLYEHAKHQDSIRCRQAFIINWEGCSVLACNVFQVGSEFFESRLTPAIDFVMTFHRQVDGTWKHTMYQNHLATNKVDLSKIAEKHGGGGHKSAAGFIRQTPIPAIVGTPTPATIFEYVTDYLGAQAKDNKDTINQVSSSLVVAVNGVVEAFNKIKL